MALFHPMIQTVEVTIKGERSGQERRNVIHYQYLTGRPTLGQLQALANEVETQIVDKYEDLVATGTHWYEIECRDMHDLAGIQYARAINRLSVNGTQAAPANVSLCLTKRTAVAGPSNRGRFYTIDCSEDEFNGDDLNPFYNGILTDLCNTLLQSRVSSYFIAAVGSRLHGNSRAMVSMTFDQIADSQRRRLKGRGS